MMGSLNFGETIPHFSRDIIWRCLTKRKEASQYALSLDELDECISDKSILEQSLEAEMLAKAINDFLRTLPDDARNTFIGRYYFLDSLRDVANYCGMSESKAKSMLFRTRRGLQAYLKKELPV